MNIMRDKIGKVSLSQNPTIDLDEYIGQSFFLEVVKDDGTSLGYLAADSSSTGEGRLIILNSGYPKWKIEASGISNNYFWKLNDGSEGLYMGSNDGVPALCDTFTSSLYSLYDDSKRGEIIGSLGTDYDGGLGFLGVSTDKIGTTLDGTLVDFWMKSDGKGHYLSFNLVLAVVKENKNSQTVGLNIIHTSTVKNGRDIPDITLTYGQNGLLGDIGNGILKGLNLAYEHFAKDNTNVMTFTNLTKFGVLANKFIDTETAKNGSSVISDASPFPLVLQSMKEATVVYEKNVIYSASRGVGQQMLSFKVPNAENGVDTYRMTMTINIVPVQEVIQRPKIRVLMVKNNDDHIDLETDDKQGLKTKSLDGFTVSIRVQRGSSQVLLYQETDDS